MPRNFGFNASAHDN